MQYVQPITPTQAVQPAPTFVQPPLPTYNQAPTPEPVQPAQAFAQPPSPSFGHVPPTMPVPPIQPMAPAPERPVSPTTGPAIAVKSDAKRRGGGAYYFMLLVLIGLSIYTLYLYQERMNPETVPHIAAARGQMDEEAPYGHFPPAVELLHRASAEFIQAVPLGSEPIPPEMLVEFHNNNAEFIQPVHLPETLPEPVFFEETVWEDEVLHDVFSFEEEMHQEWATDEEQWVPEQAWGEEVFHEEWGNGEVQFFEEGVLEVHHVDGEFDADWHDEDEWVWDE